jgi:tellurite resistance protein TehA-like permease
MRIFRFHDYKLINVIKNFTPNWFAVNMGTGISAICLEILLSKLTPYNYLPVFLWGFNILLFLVFSVLFCLKIIIYPKLFINMLKHSSQPMFLGCIPMGLVTIINGCVIFGIKLMGFSLINITLNLWWIDVFLSLFCITIVPYFMFVYHDHKLENMTGLWLLPFVACEVASASGNLLLPYIDINSQNIIFIVSFFLWTISIVLAFHILVILFYRLTIHKIPSSDLSATIWLPVGPMGTGSFAMFLFSDKSKLFYNSSLLSFFDMKIFSNLTMILGIVLWVVATWWVIIAILITFYYAINKLLRFNLGFWGYTFPLGVYILATNQFFNKSKFTIIWYEVYSLIIILVTIMLFLLFKTLQGFYTGELILDSNLKK